MIKPEQLSNFFQNSQNFCLMDKNYIKQAEAEVMPSSNLVEVDHEIGLIRLS